MKVLIVGSEHVAALEKTYIKYLKQDGFSIYLFPAQDMFFQYYHKSLVNKLWFRAGFSNIHATINVQLKESINAFKPDIIWAFKGMEILPETLTWAKHKQIKVVNYNPDNPFVFSGFGSGNTNITDSIGLYDLHFTYHLEVKKKLENEFKANVEFLPFGFDVSAEIYFKCITEPEIIRTCFLGNPDKERAAFILQLAGAGIEIDVYGTNWQKFIKHKNIHAFGPVYQESFWFTLYKYRVQLNLMRIHNLQSHNMRSFEIPGVGGIQLAPDTPEHRMFFVPDKNIFLFDSIENCKVRINQLLAKDEIEIKYMRKQIRDYCIDKGYEYKSRAKIVKQAFENLMN